MFTLAIFFCHKKLSGIVWTWSKSNHNRFYITNYFQRSWYFPQKYFYPFMLHRASHIERYPIFRNLIKMWREYYMLMCHDSELKTEFQIFLLFRKDAPKLISLSKSEVWSKRKTERWIQKGDFIVKLWVVSWKTYKLKRIVGPETINLKKCVYLGNLKAVISH